MTKEVFKIRILRSKRRREKVRSIMNTVYFLAWFGLLMPFAVYSAYISRGCRMCIGGEWLLIPAFFMVRYIIGEMRGAHK